MVKVDSLGSSAGPWEAVVRAVDELADLAVLEIPAALDASVAGLRSTDGEQLGCEVVVTGVSEVDDAGHEYRFLDALGVWTGGTTRDEIVPLGHMKSTDVVPGMSGAPVRRVADDVVVGVVSGRYNSTDGWLQGSVWVAQSERLSVLCAGAVDLTLKDDLPAAAIDLTLTVGEREVRLHGDGAEVSAPHGGVRPALVGAVDDVRRARARAGGTREAVATSRETDSAVGLERAGRLMAESFLPDAIADRLADALASAESSHQAVRLGIVCEGELSRLPWEALPDPRDGKALVLHPLLSVYRRVPGSVVARVPGPLRILVAISSPDRGSEAVLDYERELRNVLAAVRAARQGDAYVRIVPFATMGAIREALANEPAHVLHLSGHGSPGRLVFEDEDGNARELGADAFLDEAIPPGRMPAVVALAACHSNVAEATGSPSFAARLLERGASVVIATETSVTDVYATRAFARIYGHLASALVPDAVEAVCDARRLVQAELENASSERERRLGKLDEWAVLSVLAGGGSVPILDPTETEPIPPPPPRFTIGSVAARGVGDFVGRRREQRRWPIELLAGANAGLVLHGIGGVGKTTLAAELIGRVLEREPGRARTVIAGPLTVDTLLGSVTAALRRQAIVDKRFDGSIENALVAAARSDLAWSDRLSILREHVLGAVPLLVVLDNFEDNLLQDGDGATLRDPLLAELLAAWVKDPGRSRLLITCRYPFILSGSAEKALTFKAVGPLSAAETGKLIWSLPALDQLTPKEVERVWRLVGGHPRALEYLDALLSQGEGRYPDVTDRLQRAVEARLGEERASAFLSAEWKLDDAMAEVATIAADDILLERLLAALDVTEGARSLLTGLAVYREPVDVNGALYQVGEIDESAASGPDIKAIDEQLQAILKRAGLESPVEMSDLPPAVMAEVKPVLEQARRKPTPPRAAPRGLPEMLDACVASSLLGAEDGEDGRVLFVHRWTGGELMRAAAADGQGEAITAAHRRAAEYWLWRVSVWPQSRRADVHDLLEARFHYLAMGEPESAAEVTEQVCSALEVWGAWDDETALIRDTLDRLPPDNDRVSAWIHQLGIVTQRRGDLGEAEDLYRQSLEIKERLDDEAGMASSFGQLGRLAEERGDSKEAERLYNRSLEISERLGNEDGMATGYHQLGIVAQRRGDLSEAERLYKSSLEIKKRRRNEDGTATDYHQLGIVAQRRGDLNEAERLYKRSLEIKNRLGNQAGMATSYAQLGTLAQERGDLSEADRLYRRSLEISEKLGNQVGMATSYAQLGILAQGRGDSKEAERLYRRSLQINQRLGSKEGMAANYHLLGRLARERGDTKEAERLYARSDEIKGDL